MDLLRVDLTSLVAVLFSGLVLLVPVVGLTARAAVPPIVDAVARAWHGTPMEPRLARLERRYARLEGVLADLQRENDRDDSREARSLATVNG